MIKVTGFDQLKRVAANLRAAPEAAERAAYRAVNTVVRKVSTQARRDIAAQINLPQSYIEDKTQLTLATSKKAIAYIRMRMTAVRLARFDAKQITRVAKNPVRTKGDALRAIPAGRAQAGVSVRVSRTGGRKTLQGAFLLPLRAGKVDGGNGFGIFVRGGSSAETNALDMGFSARRTPGRSGPIHSTRRRAVGNMRHLYGPSPDQLFKRWKVEAAPDIKRMLVDAYASQLRYELRGSRK